MVWGLLHAGPKDIVEPYEARCNEFTRHFHNKTFCIRQDLDSSVIAGESSEVSRAQSSPVILDEFQLVQLEDVDKVLGQVCATTSVLDPCPSWLIKGWNSQLGQGSD